METVHLPRFFTNFYSYIRWIQQSYPDGGKSELKSVLERCTSTFKDSLQYKNDERYVYIWLTYADTQSDPLDTFAFLHKQRIGETRACLYEAHSIVLETQGKYQEATKVYEKGFQMRAEPVDRLQKHFDEFQARMTRRIARMKEQESKVSQVRVWHSALILIVV